MAQPDNYYLSGGSDLIPGAARNPAAVNADELMGPAADPARPSWMYTRHPVTPDEYRRLKEAAREPQPAAEAAEVTITEDRTEDGDMEAAPLVLDPPEGSVAAPPGVEAPVSTRSFDGLPQTAWQPPDNTLAVGPNHVMVAVNTDLAVYSKTGVFQFRWPNMNPLFNPVLPPGAAPFDPRVAYDHYEQRWIIVVGARRESPPGSWIMVGVSQTSDPGGGYWVWALDGSLDGNTPSDNWADFPTLGFDTQGIYITSNMFAFNGAFQYAKLRVLSKTELYAGGSGTNHAIRWFDFWNLRDTDGSLAFTVQPAVHFRGIGGNPPAYLVDAQDFERGNILTLWTLSDPIAFWTGGNANLTRDALQCQEYSIPPHGRQPDTTTPIGTEDNRLLNAVFQNIVGSQSLWTCHASAHTWPGEEEARSVVQWYEIDVSSSTVKQQNVYGRAGKDYYYPAIQTDAVGNAYIVFGRSGEDEYASLYQTGRRVGDAPNSLQDSVLIKAGERSYAGGRWGDYFGICRDGGDSSVVWMYGEYARANGNNPQGIWGTRVCDARFG